MLRSPFGILPDGRQVEVFTLSNDSGIQVRVLSYGGIIQSIDLPDRSGIMDDIVLGFDDLNGYVNDGAYMGAVVGRFANRIGGGSFELDGQTHFLSTNDGQNCLHGGNVGFNRALWAAEILTLADQEILQLKHVSLDGDQGFPGELHTTVTYALSNENRLKVSFKAWTDKPTVVGFTLHPYFNLGGRGAGNILDHELRLNADHYLPVNGATIPTGAILPVANSPMDFRESHPIAQNICYEDPKFSKTEGYDHNWVINDWDGSCVDVAHLRDPASGRVLKVSSSMPGLQLYTGNHLSADGIGKDRRRFQKYGAVCLEPQFFPDTPNQPDFPSAVLRPGEVHEHAICFEFHVDQGA